MSEPSIYNPQPYPDTEHRFFLWDPANGEMQYFATAQQRDDAAHDLILDYCDDTWDESVSDIVAGEVTAHAVPRNVEHRPEPSDFESDDDYDEAIEAWGDCDIAYKCGYELAPLDDAGDERPAAIEDGARIDIPPRHSGAPQANPESSAGVLSPAAQSVIAERRRQVTAEGYAPAHDDEHTGGELHIAARCYLYACDNREGGTSNTWIAECPPDAWPWCGTHWKPKSQRQDLVRAGALILAEIERIDRAAAATFRLHGRATRGATQS